MDRRQATSKESFCRGFFSPGVGNRAYYFWRSRSLRKSNQAYRHTNVFLGPTRCELLPRHTGGFRHYLLGNLPAPRTGPVDKVGRCSSAAGKPAIHATSAATAIQSASARPPGHATQPTDHRYAGPASGHRGSSSTGDASARDASARGKRLHRVRSAAFWAPRASNYVRLLQLRAAALNPHLSLPNFY